MSGLAIDSTKAPEGTTEQTTPQGTTETQQQAAPQVDLTKEPPKGTPEYETWLTAKAQASLEAKKAKAPEGMPEQFFNAETGEYDYAALAKSYTELRKKMSSEGAPKKEEQTPPKTDDKTTPQDPPKDAPQGDASKVDFGKFTQELMTAGELSEASYAELEGKGFSKDFVDTYIEGQRARVAQRDARVLEQSGISRDDFGGMVEWAKTNLQASELATFNKQVKGSDESALMALQWLKSKFEGSEGAPPKTVLSGAAGPVTTQGFQSRAEAVKAMSDTRYKTDPAYRAEVDRKLASRAY